MSEIRKATQGAIDHRIAEIVTMLSVAGEQAVNEARTSHLYKDQTGNLTASIGYAVFVDGSQADVGEFNNVQAPKGDGTEGTLTGREFALSLASEFPKGITLVVVAGMKYAKYVEAMGLNVLSSSETLARDLVPKLLRDLES